MVVTLTAKMSELYQTSLGLLKFEKAKKNLLLIKLIYQLKLIDPESFNETKNFFLH